MRVTKLNKFSFFLAFILLLASSGYAETSLKDKISQLNELSIELLGIDIYSATLLVQLEGSAQFIPYYLLERDEIKIWKNLENKGYIKLNLLDEMPGSDEEGKTLSIIRTDAGENLKRRWLATKENNQTLEWDKPYCGFLELVDFENGLCHF